MNVKVDLKDALGEKDAELTLKTQRVSGAVLRPTRVRLWQKSGSLHDSSFPAGDGANQRQSHRPKLGFRHFRLTLLMRICAPSKRGPARPWQRCVVKLQGRRWIVYLH